MILIKTTQTDGKGNRNEHSYNARGLLIAKTDALGSETEYTYNANGTLASSTDRNGQTTTYAYDIYGREISRSIGNTVISRTYDANSNELSMTDSTGTTTRTYDELGRVVTKTVPDIGTATFTYDETANLTPGYVKETTTDPKSNVTERIYDKAGRLYQVKNGSDTATYAYYANGARQQMSYSNGAKEEYTYTANNKLQTLVNRKPGGNILEAYNYTYDAAGNLLAKLDGNGVTSYRYDAQNRLQYIAKTDSMDGGTNGFDPETWGGIIWNMCTMRQETVSSRWSIHRNPR